MQSIPNLLKKAPGGVAEEEATYRGLNDFLKGKKPMLEKGFPLLGLMALLRMGSFFPGEQD